MAVVTAREALRYVASREMALLYAVVIVGVLLLGLGVEAFRLGRGSNLFFLADVLRVLFVVAGTVLVYGGLIGILYKVIADAHVRGTTN
jgi:hypothetical protein